MFYTKKEAAKMIGISRPTLDKYIVAGLIKAHPPLEGYRRIRISLAEIERFKSENPQPVRAGG